jgi:hypothetical protein
VHTSEHGRRGPAAGSREKCDGVFEISEVTGEALVVKCMGRTYAAVAVSGEVAITDTTDITRPIPLGAARARDAHGQWQIVTARDDHVLTTRDLLRALAALRAANAPLCGRPGDSQARPRSASSRRARHTQPADRLGRRRKRILRSCSGRSRETTDRHSSAPGAPPR